MPSFNIHLAIANRYIQKHKIENQKEFLEGSIAPDFVENKRLSHYTIESPRNVASEHLKNKVSKGKWSKNGLWKRSIFAFTYW